ncbi:hypothetical protein V2J09_020360 [Rumex salicifolius]
MAGSSDHTATIIDGAAIALSIRSEIADEVRLMAQQFGRVPGFAVLSFGNWEGTLNYVNMKREACDEVGMNFFDINLPEQVSESELIHEIHQLNINPNIHGILIQFPLPKHINAEKILSEISIEKDVDGFHPLNIGRLGMEGREPVFRPCIPKSCLELLTRSGISVKGKKVVVVGRSNIVGLPISLLLLKEQATVTIVHSYTSDPRKLTCEADIVIAAAGQAMMIKGDWIKPGAAVIDVGSLGSLDVESFWTSSVEDLANRSYSELVGDVNFEEARKVAGWITPVPGGVGPMTVAIENSQLHQLAMAISSEHTAKIIDGKAMAHSIRSEITAEVRVMAQKFGKVPGFAAVSFGTGEGTLNYVNMKREACDEVGIKFFDINLSEQVSEAELIHQIHELNANSDVHGIVVQYPLPKHVNVEKVLSEISIEKDVDGFHPLNIGKLGMEGWEPLFQPCISKGCLELLTRSEISVEGKKAVVIGGGSLVGLPISLLLLKSGATVTIIQPCSSEPKKLICDADIVIAAAGQAMMIKGDWIKPGAAVIDVGNLAALDIGSSWTTGTNYDTTTTTTTITSTDYDCTTKSVNDPVGDVNFEEVCKVAGWITPVPGGVGPVTVAMFLLNTLDGAKRMINN